MSRHLPDPTPGPSDADELVTFEAATAEQALADVTATLGADARIIGAEKVLRGGFRGFFAQEKVQLKARPAAADAPPAPAPAPGAPVERAPDSVMAESAAHPTGTAAPAAAAGGTALDRVLAEVSASEADREQNFGDVLRKRLATSTEPPVPAAPPAPAAAPAPAPVERAPDSVMTEPAAHSTPEPAPAPAPAPVTMAEPAPGAPDWSVDNLVRLGLPDRILASTRHLSPADDLAWVEAIVGAVQTLCRPLPSGPAMFVGPRVRGVAQALGIRQLATTDGLPRLGDVAVKLDDGPRPRQWVAASTSGRWVHLVAGGARWRGLLQTEPLAISWAAPDALPEALRCAVDLGLVLGYGVPTGTREVRRATPVDVALSVRDLVPRR